MEAYASLQVLKKRAKGDLNKQRRIKNLAKNKEFVELVQIAAEADIPGTDWEREAKASQEREQELRRRLERGGTARR